MPLTLNWLPPPTQSAEQRRRARGLNRDVPQEISSAEYTLHDFPFTAYFPPSFSSTDPSVMLPLSLAAQNEDSNSLSADSLGVRTDTVTNKLEEKERLLSYSFYNSDWLLK